MNGETMSDIGYQIQSLKGALARDERMLAVISDAHYREEVKKRIEQIKSDIKRLEEWEQKHKKIRLP